MPSCLDCADTERQLKEARAEIGRLNALVDEVLDGREKAAAKFASHVDDFDRQDKLIEQMRDAISDVLRHAEPPQHDIRGCIRANCWWCYAIRARDAALAAAERGSK